MTREELKQIYYINKEIKMYQNELERLRCQSFVKGQVLSGMPFNTGISDPTCSMATEMHELELIIQGKLAEVQRQRKRIMQFINDVPNSEVRQVLYYKHVSNMNWYRVAAEMGEGYSADAVKKCYYRFLEKNNIE